MYVLKVDNPFVKLLNKIKFFLGLSALNIPYNVVFISNKSKN